MSQKVSSHTSSAAVISSSDGEAEAHAPAHPLRDVVIHARVPVAQQGGAVAHAQVDVLVPVQVPDPGALAPIDVDRLLSPGAEVGVSPSGEGLLRPMPHRDLAVTAGGGRAGRERGTHAAWSPLRFPLLRAVDPSNLVPWAPSAYGIRGLQRNDTRTPRPLRVVASDVAGGIGAARTASGAVRRAAAPAAGPSSAAARAAPRAAASRGPGPRRGRRAGRTGRRRGPPARGAAPR